MDLYETEVHLTLERGTGRVFAVLYEWDPEGQLLWLADTDFGPYDTAQDICQWLIKQWAPRAKLPLR